MVRSSSKSRERSGNLESSSSTKRGGSSDPRSYKF
jgi:hypothetical protein